MQATLTAVCACGVKVGLVPMDTSDFNIPGAWESIGAIVAGLLEAHRQGHCSVYNPAAPVASVVYLRSPRFSRRLRRIIPR
ncbi:hypothetical protein LCGC14_1440790 [marine sediment metagenome]|uniref:Uncharacterized protein n=1 Tax=marine sediment metagenome TaxID=412755 RepID=A0A0F9K6Z5_9ZZZZ